MISREEVDQICKRSAAGEGVTAILESMNIDVRTGLLYLRDNHPQDIRDAKLMQLDAMGALSGKAVTEHAEMVKRVADQVDAWHHDALAETAARAESGQNEL